MSRFAIGHSNRPPEAFVEALRAQGVERLVDVRTVPKSRAVPWAASEHLPALLEPAGIEYVHVKDLGGLRKPRKDSVNRGWRNESFRGYADYMQTPAFEAALKRLIGMAREKTTCIMCAEAVPWRCHRSLIADALTARGVPVTQIFDAHNAKPHKMTPFAKVSEGRVTYPGPLDAFL